MSGLRFVLPYQTVVNDAGSPLAGAQLWFFASDTSLPLDTYPTPDLNPNLTNPNPVIADGSGTFGDIFLSDVPYKVILTNGAEPPVQIWAADPVQSGPLPASPGTTYIASLTAVKSGAVAVGYSNFVDLIYVDGYKIQILSIGGVIATGTEADVAIAATPIGGAVADVTAPIALNNVYSQNAIQNGPIIDGTAPAQMLQLHVTGAVGSPTNMVVQVQYRIV